MSKAAPRILASRAVAVARKRLPIINDKDLNEALDLAAGDMAEAYRIGAEEAQQRIVERLRALAESEAP